MKDSRNVGGEARRIRLIVKRGSETANCSLGGKLVKNQGIFLHTMTAFN